MLWFNFADADAGFPYDADAPCLVVCVPGALRHAGLKAAACRLRRADFDAGEDDLSRVFAGTWGDAHVLDLLTRTWVDPLRAFRALFRSHLAGTVDVDSAVFSALRACLWWRLADIHGCPAAADAAARAMPDDAHADTVPPDAWAIFDMERAALAE